MKAVNNIERITRTMQLIASARFQSMQKRATSAQAYTKAIARMVGELSQSLGSDAAAAHPLLSPPAESPGKELLLVITSQRGLCGAYNANVLRTMSKYREKVGGDRLSLEIVGKKGQAYCKFTGITPDLYHQEIDDVPEYEQIEKLAERYMLDFELGKYDAIKVVSMTFESMSKQFPRIETLLPMQPPAAESGDAGSSQATVQYDFSPDPQTLLEQLLPATVKTRLFQVFNEAVVSEQLARMVAMQSATDAAKKMVKRLRTQFNRARQTAITTELSEIIGGAAALE